MKYFDMEEFACKCCGELPVGGMNPVLLEALDQLREELCSPIFVTSGYRCPEHNREVGGVENSQHVLGNAADIICPDVPFEEFIEAVNRIGFDGIGVYWGQGFIHCDMREDGNALGYYRWEG